MVKTAQGSGAWWSQSCNRVLDDCVMESATNLALGSPDEQNAVDSTFPSSMVRNPAYMSSVRQFDFVLDRLEVLAGFLKRQRRWAVVGYALALVGVIGLFDYLTGYEVAFYPFYAIPILLMVWYGDIKAAIVMSILSAVAWWIADFASGHTYSQEWYRMWDTVVRLMFFGLVVVAGLTVRHHRDASRAKIAFLEKTQQLEEEIIEISERAQERVGRDLHDGLCQYLASVSFSAVLLKNGLEREKSQRANDAADLAHTLEQAVVNARDVARGLSPVDQDEGGLESALEELASSTSKLVGIPCAFIGEAVEVALDNEAAVHLFRIAQEAVNNAVKHSKASQVIIAVERNDEGIFLRVSDDGVGLDANGSGKKGMGLNIMRYRARKIGGHLDLQSNIPNGTVISCFVAQHTLANPPVTPHSGK